MNRYYYILILTVASLLTACQSDDNLPVQHPDGYDEIRFTVDATQETISRASTVYRSWSDEKDPSTMGVFGYHSMNASNASSAVNMFYNTKVEYSSTDKTWTSADKKYWADYTNYSQFDFFGYMPYINNSDVKLERTSNTSDYTISFPFSIDNVFLTDTRELPLICKAPTEETLTGNIQKLLFDQTLAGFRLRFKLASKMDLVRDMEITKVRIYGDNIRYKGTVHRTYTLNQSGTSRWTVGDISWSYDEGCTKSLTGVKNGENENAYVVNKTSEDAFVLNSTEYQQWGNTLFTFPSSAIDFRPTIEVTYTITTNTTEESVVTRKDVVSKIQLNTSNFKQYNGGLVDVITPIDILIAPSYLYVLADEDQHAGVVVIE